MRPHSSGHPRVDAGIESHERSRPLNDRPDQACNAVIQVDQLRSMLPSTP